MKLDLGWQDQHHRSTLIIETLHSSGHIMMLVPQYLLWQWGWLHRGILVQGFPIVWCHECHCIKHFTNHCTILIPNHQPIVIHHNIYRHCFIADNRDLACLWPFMVGSLTIVYPVFSSQPTQAPIWLCWLLCCGIDKSQYVATQKPSTTSLLVGGMSHIIVL